MGVGPRCQVERETALEAPRAWIITLPLAVLDTKRPRLELLQL